MHHQIQALILQALALETIRAQDEASYTLDLALQLAQPAGYIRTFINHGKPLEALLKRLSEEQNANHYIQGLLVLSTNTVRSHIKNIYGKLGVNRRLDAIQKAREHNLV